MAAASLVMCALVAYFFSLAILSRALVFGIANLEILVMCARVAYFFSLAILSCPVVFGIANLEILVMCAWVAYFFSLAILSCALVFGIANLEILVMCAWVAYFFCLWLFSHVLLCFGIANLEISVIMCALVAYFFFSLAILSCALVFLNCQFGDLGYVCLGGLLFFLLGYSLMCSSCFGIANLEILVMCALVAYFFFSLSLAIISRALVVLELPIWRSWLCVL
jgi:hypothetical protein